MESRQRTPFKHFSLLKVHGEAVNKQPEIWSPLAKATLNFLALEPARCRKFLFLHFKEAVLRMRTSRSKVELWVA